MDLRTALARRIELVLERELGEGIDVGRMLNSALYARDVLLVCDAQRSSELSQLAREFREASLPKSARAAPRLPLTQALPVAPAATIAPVPAARPPRSGDSSGFGASQPGEPAPSRRVRFAELSPGWLARSAGRWLGR